MAKKFYTVWKGMTPGVYEDWNECKVQIAGYQGALYKSFATKEEALNAFNDVAHKYLKTKTTKPVGMVGDILKNSLAVDAACSGNPGDMEYRGVYVMTGKEVFRMGPLKMGTNNIGEFLAIVHGLALLKQKNSDLPIYSDSVNAISWVKQKKCKTKLEETEVNQKIFELIDRAEEWLKKNTYNNLIIKWETKEWGEIPADFGRKK